MDPRERFDSLESLLLVALRGWQADLQTAMPGIIQSFDPIAMTCTVQPSIMEIVTSPADNKPTNVKLPILLDCPVFFPSGGGATLTFPVAAGDECLVVFSTRCMDAWWQSGGVQPQATFRMHDLSDGFVFAGVRSQPRKFTVSQTAVQLRTDDGAAFMEINTGSHNINLTTSGDVSATGTNVNATASAALVASGATAAVNASASASITAPTITLTGNVIIAGTLSQTGGGAATMSGSLSVTGSLTAQGTNLHTHVHSGVTGGTANTGAPV